MSSAPRLVEQLAGLTSIRDLELLELSLMKTLYEFMQPCRLAILKLDSYDHPTMEITFDISAITVNTNNITVSDTVRAAFGRLQMANPPENVITISDDLLTIYRLQGGTSGHTYLMITAVEPISDLNAHLLAGMLQVYRNFSNLLLEAQTDQLTGLANRKTFDACVGKVYEMILPEDESRPIDRREPSTSAYWLAMVDIDRFKLINDRFGHLYGDEVLVLLAQVLKSAFRDGDMIFRFGGEEFVLIIRCVDIKKCREALERLRRKVEACAFPQVGQVTISIGAVQMVRETFAMTLLDYADQAMYHSKQHGRNQVTFFEDLLASGLAKMENIAPGRVDFF